ncbi:hypothetical protein [Kitasatospora sp. McL0602]|uniref:hypothetical protein n=1 Tax=Kitasatospora sp. McL0602 TaxID=3439530 RepID=UPI003F887AE9
MIRTRSRKAALALTCILLPALLSTACDHSERAADTATTPASVGASTGGAKAQGKELAAAVALTPADWGREYRSSDPGEDAQIASYRLGADCRYMSVPSQPGLIGQMTRYVELPDGGDDAKTPVSGSTTVSVFSASAGAQNYLDTARADGKRCPDTLVPDGSVANKGAREISLKETTGSADALYAEEGRQEGDGADSAPYVYLVAAKGDVVLSVFINGLNEQTATQTETRAQQALAAMLGKLKTAGG